MRARHRLTEGETSFVVMSWSDASSADVASRGRHVPGRDQSLLARLDRRRALSRPSVARVPPAQRPHPEGPDLRADRGAAGGAHDLAAREPSAAAGTGTIATPGCVTPPSPCGRCTRSDLIPRPTTSWPSWATSSSRRAASCPDTSGYARNLQVLYPVDGDEIPTESELDHLTGYGGSRPVRIGNAAYNQIQFDILGAIVDCVFEHTRSRDSLSERSWRIVVQAVETALHVWKEPDRGIWEVRGEPQHFTFSKVMCWVAADRGARLAALRGERERADEWWAAAQEIHADICEKAVGDQGALHPVLRVERAGRLTACCCR